MTPHPSNLSYADWFFIVAVLLLAAGLRLAGVDYGQPDPRYSQTDAALQQLPLETPVHPDEYFFVGIPFQMAVTKYPNPRFFENPNFLIYTNFVTYLLTGSTDGITPEMREGVGQRQYAPFPAYVIGRVYSALGGVFTVAATYAVTRRIGGRYAAAAAGLLTAVSFTLVQHGHYATPSSIAAAFTMLCVWAVVEALQQPEAQSHPAEGHECGCALARPTAKLSGRDAAKQRGRGKPKKPAEAGWESQMGMRSRAGWMLALAGIAAGLAATARYNAAGVAIVVFLAGLLLVYRYPTRRVRVIVLVGWLLVPAAFVFGTPGIVFDFPKFRQDFTRIFTQFLTTGYGFSEHYLTDPWLSLWLHLRYLAVYSLGLLAVIAALVGVIWAWVSRPRGDFLRRNSALLFEAILLVYLFVYALVVLRNVRPSYNDHMLVPVIPVLATLAGLGTGWVEKKVRARHAAPLRGQVLFPVFVLLLVAPVLVPAVQVARVFSQPDTRSVMQRWIYAHLPRGARIHLSAPYNVPLDPADYDWTQTFADDFTPVDRLRADGVEYVVVSDAWGFDVGRSRAWMPAEFVRQVGDFYAGFDRKATLVARVFRPRWTGDDWTMHTASYWHNPTLSLYCLTPASCAAVQ